MNTGVRRAAIMMMGMMLAVPGGAQANADALVRQAEAELRAAQNLLHSGKREESMGKLVEANRIIGQVREADAANPRIAGLENRVNRLKVDLERRMGGTIDLEQGVLVAAEAPPTAAPTAAAPASPPTRLPHHADQAMSGALRALSSVQGPYSRFDYYRERGDYDAILKALDSIDEALTEVPERIEEARRLAAERGITEFPGFEEAYERLEEEKARSARTRQETLQLASAAADASQTVTGDVEAFAAAYDRLRELLLNQVLGHARHFTDLEEAGRFIDVVESFEQSEIAPARRMLADFAEKYGATSDDIDRNVRRLGYQGNRLAGTIYQELTTGLDNIASTRNATAAELLRRAREDLDDLHGVHDFYRGERRDRVRAFAEMAARYDGDSAEIRGFLNDLPARFDADIKAINARIDGRTWPESAAGKRTEQQAGLKFFREDSGWGARPRDQEPRIPVALAITGDWSVQQTDLLGRPTMYGIPALIAVEVPEEKRRDDVLRVYNVTLRTAESASPKQEPPFREITVGDSYYIRPRAVR